MRIRVVVFMKRNASKGSTGLELQFGAVDAADICQQAAPNAGTCRWTAVVTSALQFLHGLALERGASARHQRQRVS
jgi:hypothetical protein